MEKQSRISDEVGEKLENKPESSASQSDFLHEKQCKDCGKDFKAKAWKYQESCSRSKSADHNKTEQILEETFKLFSCVIKNCKETFQTDVNVENHVTSCRTILITILAQLQRFEKLQIKI